MAARALNEIIGGIVDAADKLLRSADAEAGAAMHRQRPRSVRVLRVSACAVPPALHLAHAVCRAERDDFVVAGSVAQRPKDAATTAHGERGGMMAARALEKIAGGPRWHIRSIP